MNRYARSVLLEGKYLSASDVERRIYTAVNNNAVRVQRRVLKEGERLDIIAGKAYGSGAYWWIIAAASGIGWSPQIPAGTMLRIPVDLNEVMKLVV